MQSPSQSQRTHQPVATPNWSLLREADFSGTLATWHSEPVRLTPQPNTLPGLDLDRILAYAG